MAEDSKVKIIEDPRIARYVIEHINEFNTVNPFLSTLGIRLTEIGWGYMRLDSVVTPGLTNLYHIAFGGFTSGMADVAMGGACFGCNKKVVTLDMTTNCMKAIPEGARIYAVGRVIHNGSHTMVCTGDVYDESGESCLHTQGTFYVINEFKD